MSEFGDGPKRSLLPFNFLILLIGKINMAIKAEPMTLPEFNLSLLHLIKTKPPKKEEG
jgi:hypothetical protein